MRVDVYYHDWAEVDPSRSWTQLCSSLAAANYVDITQATNAAPVMLFDYARPDVVVAVNGAPVVSLEQTRMNPSGHNIPQRFSSVVKAAELGVPGIIYYPEYSKRTSSDPNPRYLNPRVPLAQIRLSETYQAPSLSIFWPTDQTTNLPVTGIVSQQQIATTVDELIRNGLQRHRLLRLPTVQSALQRMDTAIRRVLANQHRNNSVRAHFPGGIHTCSRTGAVVDPPRAATLVPTVDFITNIGTDYPQVTGTWPDVEARLRQRDFTLIYKATSNSSGTDSEHPYPGYFTLLDALYVREPGALFPHQRVFNLAYRLPVAAGTFVPRMKQAIPPKATYIVDSFADLILLDGGVVPGRPVRGVVDVNVSRR